MSIQSEASNTEVHLKKGDQVNDDGFLSSMTFEQIQDWIINAVKPQFGRDALKTHSTPSLKPRGLMHSAVPVATNL